MRFLILLYGGIEMPKVSKKQQACTNRYIAKAYDRINLVVKRGQKEQLKAHAGKYDGGSVNAFIKRAIAETIARDNAEAAKQAEAKPEE